MRVGAALRIRASWLGRPWFFVAIAVLALNDHVFKTAWPGWLTGKLSDFAGLVVVATLAAVLVGSLWGPAVAGLAFVALKTVPGVAEAVAPLLGGGVTLRDPSDLLALVVLPPLWLVLRRSRPDQRARNRRAWQAVGLMAAVLATTATQPAPQNEVRAVGTADDAIFVEVFLANGYGERWLRTTDGGLTWTRADEPKHLVAVSEKTAEGEASTVTTWTDCANDGVCYRAVSTTPSRSSRSGTTPGTQPRYRQVIERKAPGADWATEVDGQDRKVFMGMAVQPGDSSHAVSRIGYTAAVTCREPSGAWRQVDVIELAQDPEWMRFMASALGNGSVTLVIAVVLSVLGWVLVPGLGSKVALQIMTVVGAIVVLVLGILAYDVSRAKVNVVWFTMMTGLMILLRWTERASKKASGHGFDPPKPAR